MPSNFSQGTISCKIFQHKICLFGENLLWALGCFWFPGHAVLKRLKTKIYSIIHEIAIDTKKVTGLHSLWHYHPKIKNGSWQSYLVCLPILDVLTTCNGIRKLTICCTQSGHIISKRSGTLNTLTMNITGIICYWCIAIQTFHGHGPFIFKIICAHANIQCIEFVCTK